MKFRILLPVLLLSLGLAPTAFAQRASLADRVAALEAQSTNTQGNTDLLNQVNQLRSDLTDLRGTVEQLQNENAQLKQRARDQYLDLDGRLGRLEGSGGGAAPAASAGAVPPVALPQQGGSASAQQPNPAVGANAEAAPSVHGDAGAMAQAGDERTAYGVAFDALKKGEYADSANLFTSFLQLYPSGVYAPNALYWLGESYYVTQNYQMAADQFRALLSRYPTHDKASGALLKLGLAQYGLGKVNDAEATLQSVIQQYPNSDVARTAEDRLHSIQVGQIR
ncbi:tol-pal system protein YbgF [Pseudoxanthomonas sp.]|uniref:tol-pal system protein YbgF n=1 Tax=Pseudoxanthomonas sp. TaxID=1871049 RepID=UPI00260D2547|nr:tol-pal system protein YbgF [Pseudoxanthomonas sp.]WDS38196.1 MAG: tol-pal system protein YbgF [Pseudoxanthomonas sp.]